MNVLLSIKPEYVARIFSGEKRFEYRKRAPGNSPQAVILIYCTSPTQKVVGEIHINGIIEETPGNVWSRTSEWSGIEREQYFSYFTNRDKAFALQISKFIRYKNEVIPHEVIDDFTAPQSFRYISKEETRRFRQVGVIIRKNTKGKKI